MCIKHVALLIVLFALPASAQDPNIILILTDDLAIGGVSAYGSGIGGMASTPAIDSIATAGVRFTNAYHFTPVCTPARVQLWTGQTPLTTGVYRAVIPLQDTVDTVMDSLFTDGYDTMIVGKWQTYVNTTGTPMTAAGLGWTTIEICVDRECETDYTNPELTSGAKVGHTTTVLTTAATDAIDARDGKFFLVLSHKAPHAPYIPNILDEEFYDDTTPTEPATLYSDRSGRATQVGLRGATSNARLLNYFATWTTPPFSNFYGKNTDPGGLDTDAKKIGWLYKELARDYHEVIHAADHRQARRSDLCGSRSLRRPGEAQHGYHSLRHQRQRYLHRRAGVAWEAPR
jgi:arylsulfatase A-like enzyme